MSPRGKAKAKPETEENGKERRVRESRNVKAASYKDLSDSEEEKPARRKKKDSEEEFSSEEEKPKKKVTKGRRASARSKKAASESDEASDATEGSSEDESRKKRKMAPRKTTRSLRAPQKTSYKDLSDSEEDSNEDEDLESASEEEEVSSKSSGKQKRGRGRPSKASKKEESSDSEEDSKKDRIAESDDADSNSGPADSTDNGKAKVVTPEKNAADSTVSKKDRPEHEMSEDNESDAEDQEEAATKKRVRPDKGKDEEEEEKDEEEGNDEPQAKKAKVTEKPALNKAGTDYSSINFSSDAKNKNGDLWNFKISSWNAAGLRALIKKNGLEFIKHEKPDILCLQETKCSEKKLPPEAKIDGYHAYWLSGEKDGYAGVALLSKTKPTDVKYGIDNPDFDTEGRVITAEYDKFFLVNVYVVNSGQGLKTLPKRLEWNTLFQAYLKKLDEKKPVILCGDMNVAHSEIDLTNPKTNVKNAGFTPQERDGMTQLLKEGFVDTFRNLYPDKTGAYTFWTYMGNARSRNVGWRLDYFLTSERFLPHICDNIIRSEVYGSDHCPITLLLNL